VEAGSFVAQASFAFFSRRWSLGSDWWFGTTHEEPECFVSSRIV